MGAVSVVEVASPLERPWLLVPRGRVLKCPGRTRDPKRLAQGRHRCEEPVVRSAVRGDLRYRIADSAPPVHLALLYTTHRCHLCGTLLELEFTSLPLRPRLEQGEA